jgi:hypothetical protein
MALVGFKAPPLPLAPADYNKAQQDQLIRALQLYFNRLDSLTPQAANSYTADAFYGGSFIATSETFTASGAVAVGISYVLGDATAGAVTITLPLVAQSVGRAITIKKTDSTGNTITIDGNGSETIDGATTVAISTQYGVVSVYCDGVVWWVV